MFARGAVVFFPLVFLRVSVDCAVSEWGSWGVCAKDGRSCGAKYGIQTRVRQIVQLPSSSGKICPENTEDRPCVIEQPICPGKFQKQKQKKYGNLKIIVTLTREATSREVLILLKELSDT